MFGWNAKRCQKHNHLHHVVLCVMSHSNVEVVLTMLIIDLMELGNATFFFF